jgi:DNA-binding MarR family transcriptional regulator
VISRNLVTKVGRRQAVRFAELLKPLDLRPKHFALLNVVALSDGPSQQQVGEALGLDPSGLISAIDELEARRLLERRRDPGDRRRYALFLSEAGEATLTEARKAVLRRGKELVAQLSDAEAQSLHDLLLKVAAADELDLRPGADWD